MKSSRKYMVSSARTSNASVLNSKRQDRERRNAAEAKKLEKEANAIAEIINKDFADWKTQIRKVNAQFFGRTDVFSGTALGDDEPVLVSGTELPASIVDTTGGPGPMGGGGGGDQSSAAAGKSLRIRPTARTLLPIE